MQILPFNHNALLLDVCLILAGIFLKRDELMELIFLGTSAGVPTRTRNVTAILLNLQHPTQSGLWLFDCGEGTSISYCIPPLTLENWTRFLSVTFMAIIFLVLPGLLCSRSMSGIIQPLTIYGPQGIREFVETALRISGSWTDYPLEIVEIGAGEILDDGLRKVTAIRWNTHWNVMAIVLKNMINRVH